MRLQKWHLCTTAMITCLSVAGAARAAVLTEIDIIPNTPANNAETQQNSEPSLGVNPNNPNQIVAGAFTGIFSAPPTNVTTPYYSTINGGASWVDYSLPGLQTLDKSIAWQADGTNPLTAVLHGTPTGNDIQTWKGTIPAPGGAGRCTSRISLSQGYGGTSPGRAELDSAVGLAR